MLIRVSVLFLYDKSVFCLELNKSLQISRYYFELVRAEDYARLCHSAEI